jgi:hypothetical protein
MVSEKAKTLQWMQPRNGHISEIFTVNACQNYDLTEREIQHLGL